MASCLVPSYLTCLDMLPQALRFWVIQASFQILKNHQDMYLLYRMLGCVSQPCFFTLWRVPHFSDFAPPPFGQHVTMGLQGPFKPTWHGPIPQEVNPGESHRDARCFRTWWSVVRCANAAAERYGLGGISREHHWVFLFNAQMGHGISYCN